MRVASVSLETPAPCFTLAFTDAPLAAREEDALCTRLPHQTPCGDVLLATIERDSAHGRDTWAACPAHREALLEPGNLVPERVGGEPLDRAHDDGDLGAWITVEKVMPMIGHHLHLEKVEP